MLFITLLLILLYALVAGAEHTESLQWMRGYTDDRGTGCCSDYDCVEATVALLAQGPTEVLVRIGDIEVRLPAKRVHQSQGQSGMWCFVPQSDKGTARLYTDSDGQRRAVPPATPTAENTRCVFYLAYW